MTLSFRSTEFIDDAVRDNIATNKLEIKEIGWALGQISTMEDWYAQLRADPNLLGGKTFNVTGYSLGGHLATAFNILRREEAQAAGNPDSNPVIATYTFNGAGTGAILDRRLTDVLASFNRIRSDYTDSPEWRALSSGDQNLVRALAQSRVDKIVNEQARVAGLSGVANSAFGGQTAPMGIQAELGYQIAAMLVGQGLVGASNFPLPGGVNYIPFRPKFASSVGLQGFDNMIEVVGSDSGNLGPSFVSNSGIHYGSRQQIYIEDQPATRGAFPLQVLQGLNFLVDNPAQNDFADTHSLVLLVDSLSLLAAMESLDPQLTIETGEEILAAGSNTKASGLLGTQGKAEGDTLERTLDAFRNLVLGSGQAPTVDYARTLEGNTWHSLDLRGPFQQNLAALNGEIAALAEENDFTVETLVETPAAELASEASRLDGIPYRYALMELNPFAVVGRQADAPLYDQHNLNGELDLYDAVSGDGSITTEWIADRSEFLAWKILRNVANVDDATPSIRTDGETENVVYTDSESGTVILLQGSALDVRTARITFGGEGDDSGAEALTGAGSDDRLYGGSGDDALRGGRGNDYLEGGSGNDTYIWNTGDGFDTILDTDGVGKLIVDGTVVSGGFQISQNDYISSDGKTLFHLGEDGEAGRTLFVSGDLRIENFQSGDLGISLDGAGDINNLQPTGAVFTVPYHPWSSTLGFGTEGADYVLGSESLFVAKGGDDLLQAMDGAYTEFDAGPGDDIALGSKRSQEFVSHFFMGGGSDIAIGGDGDESFVGDESFLVYSALDNFFTQSFLYDAELSQGYWRWETGLPEMDFDPPGYQPFQGTAAEALQYVLGITNETDAATFSDDYIDGGGGSDHILGGSGSDILFGGDGDDVLTGDGFFPIPDRPQTPVPSWLTELMPYLGAPGDDYIDGGSGNDVLGDDVQSFPPDSLGGSDVLIGGEGDDVLTNVDPFREGRPYSNILDGGNGNDTLSTTNQSGGFDTLDGGQGNDTLTVGQRGWAELDGGAGNDSLTAGTSVTALMDGGSGSDTYTVSFVDPAESPEQAAATLEIVEAADSSGDSDSLSVNMTFPSAAPPLTPEQIAALLQMLEATGNGGDSDALTANLSTPPAISPSITRDESNLYIGTPDLPNWLTIADWFEGDGHKIETIGLTINRQFGAPEVRVYDVAAIESLFMVATEADDKLWGSVTGDQLAGDLGNDTLRAGEGDDTLSGGRGNDVLVGGKGADVYTFSLGDGADRIADTAAGGSNGISFGPGITADMLTVDFDSLTLRIGEQGDAIQFDGIDVAESDGFGAIDYLQFADGSSVLFPDFIGQTFAVTGESGEGESAGPDGDSAGEIPGNDSQPVDGAGSGSGTAIGDGNGGSGPEPGGSTDTPGGVATGGAGDVVAPDSSTSDLQNQIGQGSLAEDGGQVEFSVRDHAATPAQYDQPERDRSSGEQSQPGEVSDLLEAYFANEPRFDFGYPKGRPGEGARRQLALTPAEVAQRWKQIDRYMKTLAEDDANAREGASDYRIFDSWNFMASSGADGAFGFSGSTGATRGMANMTTFSGLSEGFTRLTA